MTTHPDISNEEGDLNPETYIESAFVPTVSTPDGMVTTLTTNQSGTLVIYSKHSTVKHDDSHKKVFLGRFRTYSDMDLLELQKIV